MNKINWKGITKESVIGVGLLLLALVNAILQMLGYNTLPISNENVESIITILFLILTTGYNTWKNRNLTKASQEAQQITDMIKHGELLVEEFEEIVAKFKK